MVKDVNDYVARFCAALASPEVSVLTRKVKSSLIVRENGRRSRELSGE